MAIFNSYVKLPEGESNLTMGHHLWAPAFLAADREDLEVGWGTTATWNHWGKWARWAPAFWFRSTQKHNHGWMVWKVEKDHAKPCKTNKLWLISWSEFTAYKLPTKNLLILMDQWGSMRINVGQYRLSVMFTVAQWPLGPGGSTSWRMGTVENSFHGAESHV